MIKRVITTTNDIIKQKITSTVSQASQAAREEVEKLTSTIDSNVKRAVSERWDAESEREKASNEKRFVEMKTGQTRVIE